MPKKAWFFKNKTLLGILSVMLVFGTLAIGCPTTDPESSSTTYTVTFNADGGIPAPAEQKVEEGKKVTKPANPAKTGYTFVAWYKDSAKTTQWNFDTETVTANITLYAKWKNDALVPYAGVWRSSSDAYLLQDDGTAWSFSSDGSFNKVEWSTSKIGEHDVTFNETKTGFTRNNNSATYTKNTSETKTPAAATGTLLGVWVDGSRSMELKSDKTAVLTSSNGIITLGYCVESDKLYLLAPTSNLVIVSIDITNDKPGDFSKPTSDNALAGIWKLTKDGQDYYWTLDKDGKGTFHTLGASVPVSFTVTDDKKIDGESYTISGSTLTLDDAMWDNDQNQYVDIVLTKVNSVPSGSGAGGDSSLYGTWTGTQWSLIFNSNGVGEMKQGDQSQSYIWKAGGGNVYVYSSYFGSSSNPISYTVSGSTLTIGSGDNSTAYTKQ